MRRMDRYKDDNNNFHVKRSDKNQDLYQNVSSNPKYTNITDVTNANAFEINNRDRATYSSRESYQKMKKYQNMEPIPRSKKELDDVNYLYQKHENKVYDINSVLEEARKNRQERDALEEKRKLKNTSYNILAGLNAEELEKYREEKEKNRVEKPGDNELRELIDTITSKTLAGEIDKATSVDLLSDLMATNILDKVEKPTEIEDKEKELQRMFDLDYVYNLGAYDNEKLVGMTQLYVDQEDLKEYIDILRLERYKVCELGSALVLKEYRNRGIMQKLIKIQKGKAKYLKFDYMIATVHPENIPSNSVFKKSGFSIKKQTMINHKYLRNLYQIELNIKFVTEFV